MLAFRYNLVWYLSVYSIAFRHKNTFYTLYMISLVTTYIVSRGLIRLLRMKCFIIKALTGVHSDHTSTFWNSTPACIIRVLCKYKICNIVSYEWQWNTKRKFCIESDLNTRVHIELNPISISSYVMLHDCWKCERHYRELESLSKFHVEQQRTGERNWSRLASIFLVSKSIIYFRLIAFDDSWRIVVRTHVISFYPSWFLESWFVNRSIMQIYSINWVLMTLNVCRNVIGLDLHNLGGRRLRGMSPSLEDDSSSAKLGSPRLSQAESISRSYEIENEENVKRVENKGEARVWVTEDKTGGGDDISKKTLLLSVGSWAMLIGYTPRKRCTGYIKNRQAKHRVLPFRSFAW